MKLSTYETKQIKDYLDAVRARLRGPEREETLMGIESHIHASVEARQQAGEEGNLVAAVLAEMDAPEQYGDPEAAGLPRVSTFAVASVGLLVAAGGAGLAYIGLEGRYALILLPLLCAFGLLGIILAKTAIEQIKRSGGRLTGMGLALTCYLVPLVVIVIGLASRTPMQDPVMSLVITLAAVGGSLLYVMYEIRSARRQHSR